MPSDDTPLTWGDLRRIVEAASNQAGAAEEPPHDDAGAGARIGLAYLERAIEEAQR